MPTPLLHLKDRAGGDCHVGPIPFGFHVTAWGTPVEFSPKVPVETSPHRCLRELTGVCQGQPAHGSAMLPLFHARGRPVIPPYSCIQRASHFRTAWIITPAA